MLRICLIVAVIAGLGIAGLNIAVVKDKITTLVNDRDTQKKDKETAQKSLAETKSKLKTTETELTSTKENLKNMTEAKDKAEAEAADLNKKNTDLTDKLAKTQKDLDTKSDKLAAWDALQIPIEKAREILGSVKQLTRDLAASDAEKKVLYGKYVALKAQYDDLANPEHEPDMPAGLKGKVLVADPKYDFVVLDIGQKEGVVPAGRFLVNRNGKLVARLKVQSVEGDRCIANVLPGWKLGDVMEGDQVIY